MWIVKGTTQSITIDWSCMPTHTPNLIVIRLGYIHHTHRHISLNVDKVFFHKRFIFPQIGENAFMRGKNVRENEHYLY